MTGAVYRTRLVYSGFRCDGDCRCLFGNLSYESKVAMVSWVESAESDVFEAKEILVARHPTLVLMGERFSSG